MKGYSKGLVSFDARLFSHVIIFEKQSTLLNEKIKVPFTNFRNPHKL